MKPEKLYSLLNLTPPKPRPKYHHDLIISNNYRELFNLAYEAIKDNPNNHSAVVSNLAVYDYTNVDKEVIITRFTGTDNPEHFRGMIFRNLYIEEPINPDHIKALFGHLSQNIIILKD